MLTFYPNPSSTPTPALIDAENHADSSTSLEDLVFNWLSEERTVLIVNGVDDDGQDGICVCLDQGEEELGFVFFDATYLQEHFSALPPVNQAINYNHQDKRDDQWFKERNKNYRIGWDDVLTASTIDRKTCLDWGISYAKAPVGQARIRLVGKSEFESFTEDFECEGLDEYLKKRLITAFFYFQDRRDESEGDLPRLRAGWAEDYWIVEEQISQTAHTEHGSVSV